MRMKLISAVAVVAQIILSNVCLMPMASAEDHVPTEPAAMEVMQEMVMTPANAMSPLHCDDGCITVMRPGHHIDVGNMRMPCNDGHCLAEHSAPVAMITQSHQREATIVALLPVSAGFIESTQKNELPRRSADSSFIQDSLTKTIVLRQ